MPQKRSRPVWHDPPKIKVIQEQELSPSSSQKHSDKMQNSQNSNGTDPLKEFEKLVGMREDHDAIIASKSVQADSDSDSEEGIQEILEALKQEDKGWLEFENFIKNGPPKGFELE